MKLRRVRLPFVSAMVDIVFPFRKMSTKPEAVSSERRNISAIIRVTDSEEARCSVDEQTMAGD